jgi:thymidylate kinase
MPQTPSSRGLVLAVLGPDGAGKSTVLAGLEERIGRRFGEIQRRHWRPHVLPEIGVLLGRRSAQGGPVTNPHGKRPHSAPASFVRLLYYLADYWLGYFPCIVRPHACGELLLFDRHAADMWCDPARYRLGLPVNCIRALCAVAPLPDLTFVLLADAATLAARKGELSSEAATAALARYRLLGETGRRTFSVDATQPADKVIQQIESKINEFLLARDDGCKT